ATEAATAGVTQAGHAAGTPAYMSPEQASGLWQLVGPPSDVYSLGTTLYYLLTGRPPVQDPALEVLLFRVQQGEFTPPRRAPRGGVGAGGRGGGEAVGLKGMARKREGRYATARALAADVEQWLADEPVAAYREGLAGRLGRWARQHRPWVAAAGVVLLLAVA